MFSALRDPHFRLLWLGSLSAFVGFFGSNVVQAVVAFELTHTNDSVGLVTFGRGLAQVLFAPIGGALADRWSKRSILVSSQSVTAAVFFVLAWLAGSGQLTVLHLTLSGFVIGLTFSVLGPTRSAYVLELVEPPKQANAIALNQVALNASRVVGPAVGGALVAWPLVGAAGAFVLMGASYGLAVLLQGGLPRPAARAPATGPTRSVFGDVVAGLVYVRQNAPLRAALLMFVLSVMFGFPHVTVLPGVVEHALHQDSTKVSVLFAVAAVGGLVASLAVARLGSTPHALSIYRASGIGFGLSLALLWAAHDLATAGVVMFLVGLTSGSFMTLNGTVLLRYTDPRYMGRVMSLAMLAFGGFGLLALPFGMLADAVGEGPTLAVMGVGVVLSVLWQSAALARAERAAQALPAEGTAGSEPLAPLSRR
jgi:MFS family permease